MGKISDRKFIDEQEIPTVREKPVKSWRYNKDLSDKEQVEQFRKDVVEGLGRIDKSGLPGKLKLLCLRFWLFPRLMWLFSVYQSPLSTVERMERLISSYIRKWLDVPRRLSSVALYRKKNTAATNIQFNRGASVHESGQDCCYQGAKMQ